MKYMEKIVKALENRRNVIVSKSASVRDGSFYSYQTPVAALRGDILFVTDVHYSQTTTRQINYLKRYFEGKKKIVCGTIYYN